MAKRTRKPPPKTPHLDALPRKDREGAVRALVRLAERLGVDGAFGRPDAVDLTGSTPRAGHRFYKSAGTGTGRERRNWADRRRGDRLPARKTLTEMWRGDIAARCADLKRNNTLARALANRLCDHTIADGWVFEFNSGDREFDRRAEERVNAFVDRVRLVEEIRGATEAGLFDGDRLIRKLNIGGKTLLEPIEGVRLVTPDASGKRALGLDDGEVIVRPNGNTVVAGVEKNADGEVVAYHVASWGDTEKYAAEAARTGKDARGRGITTGGSMGLGTVVPVPAAQCVMLKWPLLVEPGQSRGEPAFQASLPRFFLIDKYIGDVLIAADMATLFGLIMKCTNPAAQRESDGEQLTDILDAAASVAAGEDPEMVLEAGMVKWIGNLDDVVQVKPEFPEVNTRDYIMVNVQIVAAEINMPLALGLFDFGGLTASNAKTILSIVNRGNLFLQRWQVEDGVRPLVEFDLATAIARGELRLPRGSGVEDPRTAWRKLTISPPAPPVTNLREEIDAYAIGREKNLITGRWASRQLGVGKFEENLDVIEREKKLERSKDIAPVLTPGAKSEGAGGGGGGAERRNRRARGQPHPRTLRPHRPCRGAGDPRGLPPRRVRTPARPRPLRHPRTLSDLRRNHRRRPHCAALLRRDRSEIWRRCAWRAGVLAPTMPPCPRNL